MGVDVKGVVVTRCKNAFFVAQLAARAIANQVGPHWRAARSSEQWRMPALSMSDLSEHLTVDFRYAGENRSLHVFFDCDADYAHVGEPALVLSLGAWGTGEQLMGAALRALACLGPTYMDRNDADDEGCRPFEAPALTYLQACREHLAQLTQTGLRRWMQRLQAGELRSRDCETAIGLTQTEVEQLLRAPYPQARQALLSHLANLQPAPA
jgi:hypothetical protein